MPRATNIPIELNIVQQNRFWSRVSGVSPGEHCWLWTGHVDSFGYGHFKSHQRSLKAHRVAWTLKRGPIPVGMTLDHLCRTPRCVNPAHLQIVTNKENILRGVSPTALNAAKRRCEKHDCDYVVSTAPSRIGVRECPICLKEKMHRQTQRRRLKR